MELFGDIADFGDKCVDDRLYLGIDGDGHRRGDQCAIGFGRQSNALADEQLLQPIGQGSHAEINIGQQLLQSRYSRLGLWMRGRRQALRAWMAWTSAGTMASNRGGTGCNRIKL